MTFHPENDAAMELRCSSEGCACPAWMHSLFYRTPGDYVQDLTPNFAETVRRFHYGMLRARVIGYQAWLKRQPKLDRYGHPWRGY